jgi:NTE family protein
MPIKKQTISLVLGSGGARGYAHIGVIEELLAHNYEIKSISGSSMGALIGALYAAGKLQEYKEWVLGLDVFDVAKLIDFSFGGTGMIEGEKVFHIIEKLIGDVLIEELPIPYTAVATDLTKQKEVWLQKGSLLDAVRASIAIPTIFTPKKIAEHYLVDGGVLNPLPIAPTMADNSDLTIAVNLCAKKTKEYNISVPKNIQKKESNIQKTFFELLEKTEHLFKNRVKSTSENMGMLEIIGQSLDVMQNALLECKMAGYSPDITIDIPNNACNFYEFHRAYKMIELGRVIAQETLNKA